MAAKDDATILYAATILTAPTVPQRQKLAPGRSHAVYCNQTPEEELIEESKMSFIFVSMYADMIAC